MKEIPMLNLRREYDYMQEAINAAITQCLEHQRWIFGPEISALEESISAFLGVKHCVGISSGTDALVLALRALAIKLKDQEYFDKVDEIITTPFTFTATGDAILRSGATPVFVDINPNTYNIDVNAVKDYVSSSSQVVGILPVHLYGLACNMEKIIDIAEEHDLFVLEDVAQAFGGMWNGSKLGSMGTAGTLSFFPSKNLGGFGDGGMIATDDDEITEFVRMLLRHGGKDKYNVDHIGYNARLDTLQAAVLLAKLDFIDKFNKKRRDIAKKYTEGLKDCNFITLPSTQPATEINSNNPLHVYHQYTIRTEHRDELQTFLKDNGISTMVYYPVPLHKMKVFNGRANVYGTLAHAEQAARTVLSLPIEPLLADEEIDYVISTVRRFR